MSILSKTSKTRNFLSKNGHPGRWMIAGLCGVLVSLIFSIGLGAVWIPPSIILDSLTSFTPDLIEHQLIHEVRIPRALTAALVGAALAVAGTLMQGLTRNPLADPSIIGITQGSALFIAIALAFFTNLSYWLLLGLSFMGAALGAILVLLFSVVSKEQLSPVTLTLAGAALSMLFSSLSTGIALYYQVSQDLSFWFAGGLSGAKWIHVYILFPTVIAGLAIAFIMSRSLTTLTMGDDIATGLGHSLHLVRWLSLAAVVLLSGAAVSIAGAIGFIGLVVPHIVRSLVGVDYRYILPLSAILGSFLLVVADIGARMINPPFETPVGAITALIGVPFFLYLARVKGRSM
ncbi:ferrichrome ABC transporter permease [Alkalihalophilus pseudofirmus]|uniref:FecCD family ABC transporter permease n=1 Tax=Alkalihalophilus pseudofirmus TaxID=79885 RepID=UPI000951C384|nr:ferrichrome ABC transporter permease [Alkalihalophilus pseudofirmus]